MPDALMYHRSPMAGVRSVCVCVCATHLVQRKVFTVSESKESSVVSEHQVKHGLCWEEGRKEEEGEETKGRRQKEEKWGKEGGHDSQLTDSLLT